MSQDFSEDEERQLRWEDTVVQWRVVRVNRLPWRIFDQNFIWIQNKCETAQGTFPSSNPKQVRSWIKCKSIYRLIRKEKCLSNKEPHPPPTQVLFLLTNFPKISPPCFLSSVFASISGKRYSPSLRLIPLAVLEAWQTDWSRKSGYPIL